MCHTRASAEMVSAAIHALVARHGVGKRKQAKLQQWLPSDLERLGVDGHGEDLITMTPPNPLYRSTFTCPPLLNSDWPNSLWFHQEEEPLARLVKKDMGVRKQEDFVHAQSGGRSSTGEQWRHEAALNLLGREGRGWMGKKPENSKVTKLSLLGRGEVVNGWEDEEDWLRGYFGTLSEATEPWLGLRTKGRGVQIGWFWLLNIVCCLVEY